MLGDDGVMGTPRPSRSVCGNAGGIRRVMSWGLQPKRHGRERASSTLGQDVLLQELPGLLPRAPC